MSKHWKAVERRIARFFGTERNALSGFNSKITASDSLHKKLFIETKHKSKSAIHTLFNDTEREAIKEGKTPVVAYHKKGEPRFLVICDSRDLKAIANEIKGD